MRCWNHTGILGDRAPTQVEQPSTAALPVIDQAAAAFAAIDNQIAQIRTRLDIAGKLSCRCSSQQSIYMHLRTDLLNAEAYVDREARGQATDVDDEDEIRRDMLAQADESVDDTEEEVDNEVVQPVPTAVEATTAMEVVR